VGKGILAKKAVMKFEFEPGDYVEVVAPHDNISCCSIDRVPYTQYRWTDWFYVESGSRGVVLDASRNNPGGYSVLVQFESRRGLIRERYLRKLS
jgi:hypothetical protein